MTTFRPVLRLAALLLLAPALIGCGTGSPATATSSRASSTAATTTSATPAGAATLTSTTPASTAAAPAKRTHLSAASTGKPAPKAAGRRRPVVSRKPASGPAAVAKTNRTKAKLRGSVGPG